MVAVAVIVPVTVAVAVAVAVMVPLAVAMAVVVTVAFITFFVLVVCNCFNVLLFSRLETSPANKFVLVKDRKN